MKTAVSYQIVRQLVIGLQTTGLKAKEQLENLKKFKIYHTNEMDKEAADYLDRQIKALTDFCQLNRLQGEI